MKKKIAYTFLLFLMLSSLQRLHAQGKFFSDIAERNCNQFVQKRVIIPTKYRTLLLDTSLLLNFLKNISANENISQNFIFEIPMPTGGSEKFKIWKTDIMSPGLAAKYPQLITFSGQGIDDATATLTLDWTELGFHAMILSPVTTSIFIDPYSQGNTTNYISYFKSDYTNTSKYVEQEVLSRNQNEASRSATNSSSSTSSSAFTARPVGTQLRTYRLAVACTHQYAIAATGFATPTVAQALSAILISVNRVVGVYHTELAISMQLVSTEDKVIFTNALTDPFTGNDNARTLIYQSQTEIDSLIGDANYDVGHTFSTGAGGLAAVGVACYSFDGSYGKSMGVTGLSDPVGDGYNIDYVAHEIGHEMGATHPFNSNLVYCDNNENSSTNVEPGSGSTIMAYAGICGADNLQIHSDPQFHAISFGQISAYTYGNSCPTITNTGNSIPLVNAGSNYAIPLSTPFILTGSATDADGDSLTYSWEQMNIGAPFSPWDQPIGVNAPIFRSFQPVTVPYRYFPQLTSVINNDTTIGELMPSIARTLNFRLTARDNRASGGGVNYSDMTVTVTPNGPFVVTYPSDTGVVWNGNEHRTITWDVAKTNIAPISTSNVSIQLSTDGGYTYPITIKSSTPNTGSASIVVPDTATTSARIRIMGVNNVFYNISKNNFTINYTTPVPVNSNSIILFPNPAKNVIYIKPGKDQTDISVLIYDGFGRLVYKNYFGSMSANVSYPIDIKYLAGGVYALKLIAQSYSTVEKFVVQ